MDIKTFDALVEDARDRQDDLLTTKGQDYTRGSDDRLANFKRWGDELDVDPIKVLSVYMGKHIDSIISYVKSGGQVESEPIQARAADLHNYLYLLEGMIADVAEAAKKKATSRKRRPTKRGRR